MTRCVLVPMRNSVEERRMDWMSGRDRLCNSGIKNINHNSIEGASATSCNGIGSKVTLKKLCVAVAMAMMILFLGGLVSTQPGS